MSGRLDATVDRPGRAGLAVAALLVALFALGCFAIYRHLYQEHQANKREEAQRVLLSFEANSTRLFDYADGYLRAIRAYRADYGDGDKWQRFVAAIKAPHADTFSGVVTLLDRDGWVVYQSETPPEKLKSFGKMADLDHYRYFIDHPGDALYIGATRRGRMTGQLQYRCARPLFKNGVFDGLVVMTLLPEQLTDFYRQMSLGPRSTITVMTLEPKLIARQPPAPAESYGRLIPGLKETFGIDLAQQAEGRVFGIGSPFEANSRRDVFFKKLADYPIAIMVGIADGDIDDEMAATRRSLAALAAVFAGAVLVVCLLVLRMHAQNRRLTLALAANRAAEEQLRIAATAFDSQEGMVITDANSVIVRVNQAFTASTGYSAAEIVGQTPRLLKSGRHNAEFYHAMWQSIEQTGSWQGEIWDRRKNGEEYPKWLTVSAVKDASGRVTHYVGTHFDISERKKAEEKIQELAFFDQLTGLPNRTLLLDRLKQAMAAATRHSRYGALLFIDLDNFKTINDTLGHDNGDLLLQQVAQRLLGCIREGDTAARLGGDEFVVMLKDLSEKVAEAAAQAEAVGEKILAALNLAYVLDQRDYHCTPSIGVTLFGNRAETREELLKQADLAMYQAKAAGRNALRFFDPEMQAGVMARVTLESDLRNALRAGQFVLYYQAQVDVAGRCTGAEVLVRWQHPQRGLVFPDAFIPLAEDTGLILPLGHWVLETACAQLASWATRPECAHLALAVNVSGRQLHQKDFVAQVLAALARSGANPRQLKLELTESQLLTEVEDTIAKMNALKTHGVGFALDDFGTGYSSLAYLKRLPLEKLKIDRSFVRDILSDPNDAAIAKTIVALAHTLGLEVLAEGVETAEQRDFLSRNGCPWYQGYLFSRPLPLAAFEEFLRRDADGAARAAAT